jgi:uncharacterized membrane protein
MNTSPDIFDQLVRDYLNAVEQALAGLPEARRGELLGDLRDHIAVERAALDMPTEAAIRAILDRLGDPATLAIEARLIEGESLPVPAVAGPNEWSGKRRIARSTWVLIALGLAILLFCAVAVGVTTTGTGGTRVAPVSNQR